MEFKFVEIKSVQGQAIVNSFMNESLVNSFSGDALFPIREKDLANLNVNLKFEELVHIQPKPDEKRVLFLRKLLAHGTVDSIEYLVAGDFNNKEVIISDEFVSELEPEVRSFLQEMAKENDFEV